MHAFHKSYRAINSSLIGQTKNDTIHSIGASIGKNKRPGETGFSLMLLTEPGTFARSI